MLRSLLLILTLTFSTTFTSATFAASDLGDLFVPTEGDYSLYIIGKIFGNVDQNILPGSGSATGAALLGDTFRVFNIVTLGLGVIMVIYTLILGVLQTAHHGKVFGEKMSSLWIPIRIAIAIALLIPKANGYCFAQVIVMWLVVQGVGAADSLWNVALDYFEAGGGLNQESPANLNESLNSAVYSESFLAFLMRAGTCVYTHNLDEARRGHYDIYSHIEGNLHYLNFGMKPAPGTPIGNDRKYYECGRMKMGIWSASDFGNGEIGQEKANNANAKQLEIVQDLADSVGSDIGYQIAHDLLPTEPGQGLSNWESDFKYVQADATNYVTTMEGASTQYFIDDKLEEEFVEYIDVMREGGWILAGNYYQVLASLENKTIFKVGGENTPGFTDDISASADAEYKEQIELSDYFFSKFKGWAQENTYSEKTPTQVLSDEIQKAFDAEAAIFTDIGLTENSVNHMEGFMKMLSGEEGSTDPILRAAQFGQHMMHTSAASMIALATILPLSAIVAGICTASSPGGVIMNATLATVLPFSYGILGFMYTQGAALGVYLPMVPFIIFAIGGIGWVFAVIESMVAAPLVALGMILPEGHEIYGKAEPAYMLLINLFLRPSLMILGFLAAIMVAWLAVELINVSMENALLFGGVSPDKFVGHFVVSFMYVGILVAMFTKVFGLINMVPDRVLRWIGDNSTAFMGAEEVLQGGRQGTQETAGQAGQSGQAIASGGGRIGGMAHSQDTNWRGVNQHGEVPGGGQSNDRGQASPTSASNMQPTTPTIPTTPASGGGRGTGGTG